MADEEQSKSVDFSRFKNKIRRSEVYWKEKVRKAKEKRERRKKRKREEDALGDEVKNINFEVVLFCCWLVHVQKSKSLYLLLLFIRALYVYTFCS